MIDHDDDPIEEILVRLHDRSACFQAWLGHLRARDREFAEASVLYPWDMSEWQAAVYLLTGCELVWRAPGADVMADRSIAPVIDELEQSRRTWSSSEQAWAVHLLDVGQRDTAFPSVFEQFYFQPWVTACHVRQRIPPALTVTHGRSR